MAASWVSSISAGRGQLSPWDSACLSSFWMAPTLVLVLALFWRMVKRESSADAVLHGYFALQFSWLALSSPKNRRAYQSDRKNNALADIPGEREHPYWQREHRFRKNRKNVHVRSERAFTLNRNQCSRSPRMTVHVAPEYARHR